MKADCQPSKEDMLAVAAAEPDKQLEIKAIHTAYNQVLNRVVHRCVTSFVRRETFLTVAVASSSHKQR